MSDDLTVLRPLDNLAGDDRNPKQHDLPAIVGALTTLGWVGSVVEDQRTGLLVSGHGRRDALRLLRERGEDPPRGIEVDAEGRWLVPTYAGWASTDDSEAGAALAALNRVQERAGYDDTQLAKLLENLTATRGLAGTGYDAAELDRLRGRLGVAADPDDTDRLIEDEDLRAYHRTYWLVAAPLDTHGQVWQILEQVADIEGVDVASSQG